MKIGTRVMVEEASSLNGEVGTIVEIGSYSCRVDLDNMGAAYWFTHDKVRALPHLQNTVQPLGRKRKNDWRYIAILLVGIVGAIGSMWLDKAPQYLGTFILGIAVGSAITLVIIMPSTKRKNDDEVQP